MPLSPTISLPVVLLYHLPFLPPQPFPSLPSSCLTPPPLLPPPLLRHPCQDSDGNEGIDKEEFETFFKRTETKKKGSKAEAAAARRRLLAPLRADGPDERAGLPLPSTDRMANPLARGGGAKKGGEAPGKGAPRLHRMMRLNALDSWRKPLGNQLPPHRVGPVQPHAARPLPAAPEEERLEQSRRMGTAASNLSRAPPTSASLSKLPGTPGPTHGKQAKRALALSQSVPALTTLPAPSPMSERGMASAGRPNTTVGNFPKRSPATPAVPALPPLPMTSPSPSVPMLPLGGGMEPTRARPLDDPWRPHVTSIAIIDTAAASAAAAAEAGGDAAAAAAEEMDAMQRLASSPDLSLFEKAYLESLDNNRLNFEIGLPEEEQHTPRFHFHPAAGQRGAKPGPSGKLLGWQATPLSRVGNSIAPLFTLPDGKVMRFFHKGNARNARKPTTELSEPLPRTLEVLEMPWLPSRPMAPMPAEVDVPKLTQTVELVAPTPIVATLVPWTAPPPNFGVIDIEPFHLSVLEVVEKPEGEKEKKKPLVLEKSQFANRRRTSDGHSFFTTPAITGRAFEIDWSRVNNSRFRTLIGRQDDGGWEELAEEMNEIRDTLMEYRRVLYSCYEFYCCAEEICHDGYAMGLSAFFDFVRDIGVIDEDSLYLSAGKLESVFLATNIEDKAGVADIEQRTLNRANSDEALMRFEFFQCVVRIAISKYVRTKIVPDISDALNLFMEQDFLPKVPAAASHDSDHFRKKRLYTTEVNAVLERCA